MTTGTTAEQIVDVVTPAAGESVSEGTILEWHVKVGDFIKADDTIVGISTDKVDLELPAPASGTVSEILIPEGETVTVGQVIARIAVGVTDSSPAAADTAPTQAPTGNGARREDHGSSAAATQAPAAATTATVEQPAAETASPPATGTTAEQIVDVVTPAAGESV